MSDHIVQDASLTAVADAIRAKTGKSEPMIFPAGFVSEIESISGGGESSGDDVKFYDYDGTLVTAYSASDFANLFSMPGNPSHTGLVAQGWNWSLAKAKAYVAKYGKLNIGQMYTTDDGKTRIYIHLDEGRTSPMLGISTNGTVDVDWGDGTTHDTLTGSSLTSTAWTPAHDYAAPGDYVIKLTTNGQIGFSGENGNNTGSRILRRASGGNNINYYYRNAVKKIECGEHIVSIGAYAFYYCCALSSMSIPNSVTSIGNMAFSMCYSLSGISIPDGVTGIGSYAFYNCYSLFSVSIPDGVTSIGDNAFNSCFSLSSISLPDSVTSMGSSAFSSCHSISSINIPDSVTSIGTYMFNSCESLLSISIPDGVTSIGSNTFNGCESIFSINIPDSVTSIESSAFANCYSLSSINIPDSVTSIGSSAFGNCYSLSSISLPDSVTSIGNSVFRNCYSLSSTNIPDMVTSIETYMFNNCYSLSSISIPDGVTSIGTVVFTNCHSIKELHFRSSTPPTLASTNSFTNIPGDCIFYIPAGSLEAYQNATNWKSFASRFVEEST